MRRSPVVIIEESRTPVVRTFIFPFINLIFDHKLGRGVIKIFSINRTMINPRICKPIDRISVDSRDEQWRWLLHRRRGNLNSFLISNQKPLGWEERAASVSRVDKFNVEINEIKKKRGSDGISRVSFFFLVETVVEQRVNGELRWLVVSTSPEAVEVAGRRREETGFGEDKVKCETILM